MPSQTKAPDANDDTAGAECQAKARLLCTKRAYPDALKVFTYALDLKLSTPLRVSILDNRSAVHLKLGAPKPALRDARQMIAICPTSAKGYLRAGQILYHLQQDTLAVANYKHGLKHIAPDDVKGRELLEGMETKVRTRIEQEERRTRGRDPLLLPPELATMIFSELSFPELMQCTRVCKEWREFVNCSLRNVYKALDFTNPKATRKHDISLATVKSYVGRAKGKVEKIVFKKMGFSDQNALMYIVTRCKQLREFTSLECEFPEEAYYRMARDSKQLERLRISNLSLPNVVRILNAVKGLKELVVLNADAQDAIADPVETHALKILDLRLSQASSLPNTILAALPELQELRIDGWTVAPITSPFTRNLVKLTISNSVLIYPFILQPSLKHLEILYPTHPVALQNVSIVRPPALETLRIENDRYLTNDFLRSLLRGTTSLKKLTLRACPKLNFNSLDWLADDGHADNIVEFSIDGVPGFNDECSKEMGRWKKLERLNVSRTSISGLGVVHIVDRKDSALKWIGLDACENVARDAVEYVRKKGLACSNKSVWSEQNAKGTKKVRY